MRCLRRGAESDRTSQAREAGNAPPPRFVWWKEEEDQDEKRSDIGVRRPRHPTRRCRRPTRRKASPLPLLPCQRSLLFKLQSVRYRSSHRTPGRQIFSRMIGVWKLVADLTQVFFPAGTRLPRGLTIRRRSSRLRGTRVTSMTGSTLTDIHRRMVGITTTATTTTMMTTITITMVTTITTTTRRTTAASAS
nr:unnamed protein product [Digitaria exilis]